MSESEEPIREGRTLRSGKFVAFAEKVEEREVTPSEMAEDDSETTKSVEELQAQIDELQQKLSMAETAIDDKVGGLSAAQEALKCAREDAVSDLRRVESERKELISKHEKAVGEYQETIRALEDHLAEYKRQLEKQEVQFELVRLQALETLREKFDKERDTYLDRIQHLEKELESAAKAVGPSTGPKKPETRRRDDAATSTEGELKEDGVGSREKVSQKSSDKGSEESKASKGDPSESTSRERASVVGKPEREAGPVVDLPPGVGASVGDKHGVGSRTEDESEKGDKVKATDSSVWSASAGSESLQGTPMRQS